MNGRKKIITIAIWVTFIAAAYFIYHYLTIKQNEKQNEQLITALTDALLTPHPVPEIPIPSRKPLGQWKNYTLYKDIPLKAGTNEDSGAGITQLIQSSDGDIWGLINQGYIPNMGILRWTRAGWTHYAFKEIIPVFEFSLSRTLALDPSGAVCVAGSGFGEKDEADKPATFISCKNKNTEKWNTLELPQAKVEAETRRVLIDHAGHLWMTYNGAGGISEFDGKTIHYTLNLSEKDNSPTGTCIHKLKASNSNLYAAYCGFIFFKENNGRWIEYTRWRASEGFDFSKLDSESIQDFVITDDGTGWVFSSGGGFYKIKLTGEEGQIDKVNLPPSFHCPEISDMAYDGTTVWASSECGILAYDIQKEEWVHYTTHDGLLNNSVYSILIDHDKNKWFATDKGISVLLSAP